MAEGLDPERSLVQPADVGDAAAVRGLIQAAVARFGGVDVLVNNAGTATFGKFETLRTNLDGVYHACRSAMPHLLAQGGSIVNVSSVSGFGGDWGGRLRMRRRGR